MIGKVIRGGRVQGLIRYLYSAGRYNEHRDPRIVAGFDDPAVLEPGVRADGRRDFGRLDGLLTQPLALLGDRNHVRPVWHLPVRAHPGDPVLADAQWADIAAEIMDRTGLARREDEDAVRWVAVRHADDHIHIVATLARTDGTRPDIWNDGYRVRAACRAVEQRYGLVRTAPADRTAARRSKRGESVKAKRYGWREDSRTVLRRQVTTAAAGSSGELDFFARMEADGLLVRKRFSDRVPGQVTGYAVARPDDRNREGQPVWYGGGKLAADLTLPKLRHRWRTDGYPRPAGSAADYRTVIHGRRLSGRTARALLRITARQAASASQTADEFFAHLESKAILVRRRYSQTNPGQVTGYAVALLNHIDQNGQPRWYTASSLADDLSLPRLEARWHGPECPARDGHGSADLTSEEREAFYADAVRAAKYATAQLRRHLVLAPHAARDACWAASDILHVAAKATGNPHLRRAADAYDRAARQPYGRIPRPSSAGNELRAAARLLALAGLIDPTTAASIALVASLIALLDTIDQVHRAQHRSIQAQATRSARSHLSKATARKAQPAPAADPVPVSDPAARGDGVHRLWTPSRFGQWSDLVARPRNEPEQPGRRPPRR